MGGEENGRAGKGREGGKGDREWGEGVRERKEERASRTAAALGLAKPRAPALWMMHKFKYKTALTHLFFVKTKKTKLSTNCLRLATI